MLKQMKQYDWISKRAVDNVLNKAERNGKRSWFHDYHKDEVYFLLIPFHAISIGIRL